MRRRFAAQGHYVVSCDILPAEDGADDTDILHRGGHWQGDVFEAFLALTNHGVIFDMGIFHPTCTMHTVSSAWAFNDPDYVRYPGVGYHQKVKPDTLVGAARREARKQAEADIERIIALPIKRKAIENPGGTLTSRTSIGRPSQVIQPYEFGDNASKKTCLWLWNLPLLPIDPAKRVAGRMVEWPRGSGKMVERWANQTDSNQNNLTPSEDRWKDRSRTYAGIADAAAATWGV
jgi:hypothetical protein